MRGAMMVAIACVSVSSAAEAAKSVSGRWVTEEETAIVEIGPCVQGICGKVLRILPAAAHEPKTDVHNPNPSLRSRPIIGLTVLYDFKENGEEWRGRIYSPKEGDHYRSTMRLNPDGTLRVKGCLAFFCKTQTWKPVH